MSANTRFIFGEFQLDPALLELREKGRAVPLGRSALLVLERLVRARGGIVSQAELLAVGWSSVTVTEGSLRQAICELRRALAGSRRGKPPLQTIRGEGYRLTIEVAEQTAYALEASDPALVGRSLELARLCDDLRAARAGSGKTVLLSGPPGVGKTHLAQALLAQARAEPVLVLFTRAESDCGAPPLWPWTTLLSRCLAQLAPALREGCEAAAPSLMRLLRTRTPGTPEYAAFETPEQQRFLLFEELASTFARLSVEKPLLVLFDDLHAADELSQAFFARLAREVKGRRVLLAATVRPLEGREQRRLARLLAGLDHAARPEQLALENLSVADLGALFEHASGGRVGGGAAARVHTLSRGNPLFSLELLRLLENERASAQPGELPSGAVEVHAVIVRRLAQLSHAARSALSAAAVIGDQFALAELCGVAGEPSSELSEALCEARAAAMLLELPESGSPALSHGATARFDYRFAHPLLREAAYHALELEPRRALHRRFARWLERRGAGVIATRVHELAHHFYSAGSEQDAEQAARYLAEAALRAGASTAFETAAVLYERALRMHELAPTPDPERELALKLRYAEALRAAGGPIERVDALFRAASEEARALGHRELFARAALGYAGQSPERFALARIPNQLDPRERSLLEQALAMLGTDHPELRALLLAALALSRLYTRENVESRTLMAEARALVREADPAIRARVLSVQVFVDARPGREREQSTAADELVELASSARLPTVRVDALVTRAILHYQRGDGARSGADLREARRSAELGGPESASRADLGELFRSYLDGRLRAFEALTSRLFHAERDPLRARVAFMVRMLALQFLRHGESHTKVSFDGVLEGAFAYSPGLGCMLAMNYATSGERAQAERELDAVAAHDFAALPASPTLVSELTMLSVAACLLGDKRRASQLYARLLPYSERMVVYGWEALPGGPVATALAMLATTLGELSEAAHWYERAIALCRKLEAPLYEQLTKSEYIHLLALRGTADDLRKLKLYARQLGSFGRLHGIGVFEARALEAERTLERLSQRTFSAAPTAEHAEVRAASLRL